MARTFPVDLTAKYRPYNTATATFEGPPKAWPRVDGGEIIGSDPDVELLEILPGTKQAFDDATERLSRIAPVVDLTELTATRTWEIVALTAPQIAARASEADALAERVAALAEVGALTNGVGNVSDRLDRIERAVSRLVRDTF
jgi:hypothetical protein